MRARISHAVNSLLTPLGVKIVRAHADTLDATFAMESAVRRITEHGIPINSVIDIGASNGEWSLMTMGTFPRASYIGIEPLRERRPELEVVKQKHENFDYALCVAGRTDGEDAILNISDDLDGSTVDGTGGQARSVPVKTVDAIVRERKLEGPFLLKFDTHGYEVPILMGAKETLTKTNVIVMEVYNFKITDHAIRFHEMCSHLEQLGFRCYDIAGPSLRLHDKAFWQMDMFFARTDSGMFSSSEYR